MGVSMGRSAENDGCGAEVVVVMGRWRGRGRLEVLMVGKEIALLELCEGYSCCGGMLRGQWRRWRDKGVLSLCVLCFI